MPHHRFATLKVLNLLGEEVTTSLSDELSPGTYTVTWDAGNKPSGIYFYRLQAGDASTSSARGFVETRKMVLLR